MTTYRSLLLATLFKALCMCACAAQVHDPLDDWSNVEKLATGTQLIVVTQSINDCVLDHADDSGITCASRLKTRALSVDLSRRIERRAISTVLLRRTPQDAAQRKEQYKLGALAGGEVGALAGALIGRKNGDGFQGFLRGGLIGAGVGLAIVGVVRSRHDLGATVIYQVP